METFDFKSETETFQIFSRERDKTETFDFGSETETKTLRTDTETFYETLHTSELEARVFLQGYHDDDQFSFVLILYNGNKHHNSFLHC